MNEPVASAREAAPTPTPWAVENIADIKASSGVIVSRVVGILHEPAKCAEAQANAALIVTAVNERAALLARVEELRSALSQAGAVLRSLSDSAATYPRPSNDPNGRTLVDLVEIPKWAAAEISQVLADEPGDGRRTR